MKNGIVYVNTCVMPYLYVSRGPNGYPMGMDIHRVWTWTQFFARGFFHERAKIVFMDMDMDLILFNPIQTRPIAILILAGGKYLEIKASLHLFH